MTPEDITLFVTEQRLMQKPWWLFFKCGCSCLPSYFGVHGDWSFSVVEFLESPKCGRPRHTESWMKSSAAMFPLTMSFIERTAYRYRKTCDA